MRNSRSLYLVPHFLTGIRIFLVAPIMYGIIFHYYVLSSFLFLLAMSTDFLDGFFARWLDVETSFGALFDIVADKCLILGTISALFFSGYASMRWFLYIVLLRECLLMIGSILLYVFFKPYPIATQPMGKCSMALQFVVLLLIMCDLSGYMNNQWIFIFSIAACGSIFISLADYVKKALLKYTSLMAHKG